MIDGHALVSTTGYQSFGPQSEQLTSTGPGKMFREMAGGAKIGPGYSVSHDTISHLKL